MSALTSYCDKIYEYICQYGEEYIEHIGWKVEHLPPKESYQRDYQQETIKRKPFEGDFALLEQIGAKCFATRQDCFSAIEQNIILCESPNAKERYAKLVIEDMSHIILNHPIAKYDKFKSVVLYEVFGPILGLFEKENVNLSPFLDEHRELGNTLCSFFMSDKNDVKKSKESEDKNKQESFKDLFFDEYKPCISKFIERLEEEGIIKDSKYNHKGKNYLAKLICYMQKENIVKKMKYRFIGKCFYGYFGVVLVEKAESKEDITLNNVEKTLRKDFSGLSGDEKKEFKEICSVFIPKRE